MPRSVHVIWIHQQKESRRLQGARFDLALQDQHIDNENNKDVPDNNKYGKDGNINITAINDDKNDDNNNNNDIDNTNNENSKLVNSTLFLTSILNSFVP